MNPVAARPAAAERGGRRGAGLSVACVVAALLGALSCARVDGGTAAADAMPPGTVPAASWDGRTAWRKPSEAELRRRLTPLQFAVTQEDATEPPFRNEYADHHAPGLYVDVVSGEPLFSSLDKFDSGTGWPSFTRPLSASAVRTRTDWKLVLPRTEVRSAIADSHLGHVFDDGPPPAGRRWCMNSAALRFVPVDRLEAEGYGAWLPSFAKGRVHGGGDGTVGAPAAGEAAATGTSAASPAAVPRENPPRPAPPER